MDPIQKLTGRLFSQTFAVLLLINLSVLAGFIVLSEIFELPLVLSAVAAVFAAAILGWLCARLFAGTAMQPLRGVWQAIQHVAPGPSAFPAPKLEEVKYGRPLVEAMTGQIYNLITPATTSVAAKPMVSAANGAGDAALLRLIPLPILALDKTQTIRFVNQSAADYLGHPLSELTGKPLNDVALLSFTNTDTFEAWLAETAAGKITDSNSWDRVRLQQPDNQGNKQFDLAAHYTKDDPNGYETLLVIFDHTSKYNSEDSSASYVALAVHELRTPLTVLRGYIEVLEDELGEKLTPELNDFMRKMSASAQTLTAFVSNILNVARVDENQLTLSLHEASWNELLPAICKDLELRAKVRGISLELSMQPNLPSVAVDKISIYEVLSNLVENAVKYSGDSKKVTISATLGKDGRVDTVVQDYGIGIPDSIMKNLFTKFYRSHRSKGNIGGTGLGLYLVKALVSAHGGEVWVSSRENAGSSFGFSLVPYASLSAEQKETSGGNIERQAHGWIKNHSMYRR